MLVHNSCNHGKEWDKERRDHWKEESKTAVKGKNYGAYVATQDNIDRMALGKVPIGWDGYSVQLHYLEGVTKNFYNYTPVSRTLHIIIYQTAKLF